MLSYDWQTLDDIGKGSDNSTKKKVNTEEDKSASVGCCITKYDVNTRWAMCTECRSWIHYLCEGIPPNTYFDDDAVYECLSCKPFIPETQILVKTSDFETKNNINAAYIGDTQGRLLETLDRT